MNSLVKDDVYYPLTTPQQAIFLHQIQLPRSPLYNTGGVIAVEADIDPQIFCRAVNLLIQKHDALRLHLVNKPDPRALPVQMFADKLILNVPWKDLSTAEDPEATAFAEAERQFATPFDLYARDGLVRFTLCKLARERSCIIFVIHHLVADAWSNSLIMKSLGDIYNELTSGNAIDLPTAPSYSRFIEDDRMWRQSDKFARQQNYWLKKFSSLPEALLTPYYQSQFDRSNVPAGHEKLPLGSTALAGIKTLAHKLAVTPFHVVIALLAVCFSRSARCDELTIGLPAPNRSGASMKATAGLFASVIPLRLSCDQQQRFAVLVKTIQATLRQDCRHQRFMADEICQQSDRQQTGRQRLYDLTFSYETDDFHSFGQYAAQMHKCGNGHESLPLAIQLREDLHHDDAWLHLIYSQACFKQEESSLFAARFHYLLKQVTDNSQATLAQLDTLPADERELLLNTWNQTDSLYPVGQCIHKLFEAQVARNPDTPAVVYEEQSLSYGELNRQASQLAHHLTGLGIQPDDRVALCVTRSPQMIVALLGILKAGGAYVPLDPAYPGERLRYILGDAQPRLLLVDEAGRAALGEHTVPVIALDEPLPGGLIGDNPKTPDLTSSHLAYVIYTSGSTGQPKGVMVEHRQLSNLVHWHGERFGLKAGVDTTMTAGTAFDASAWEVWGALATGATLRVPPARLERDIAALLAWWREQPVSVAFLSTPLAERVIRENSYPPSLRCLLTGGDALHLTSASLPERLRLINNYGPTESTVVATSGTVTVSDGDIPTIGRPIANTRIYLLDEERQPVPVGAVGEIYIGGAGVARGYLNRAAQTAERFLPDPFSSKPGARMYRSGDLARYLPDGNLVYLGRNDEQVKVRGFRVEPGEIAARISEHEAVREAAVIARTERGEAQLVAYIVAAEARADDSTLPGELRNWLSGQLPDYMIPAACVRLPRLPLTPNGKLDRRALPVPAEADFARALYEAPQGETETLLAAVWGELLGVARVSRYDNFFALGGHSLLAVTLMEKVREAGFIFPLNALFGSESLASLALMTEKNGDDPEKYQAIMVRQSGSKEPVFCLPDGTGDYGWAFSLARNIDPSWPVYVLPWPSATTTQVKTMAEMASFMLPLLEEVCPQGPCLLLGYSSGGLLAHEIALQLQRKGREVRMTGLIDTKAEFSPPASVNAELICRLLSILPASTPLHNNEWIMNLLRLSFPAMCEELKRVMPVEMKKYSPHSVEWLLQIYCYAQLCSEYRVISGLKELYLFNAREKEIISQEEYFPALTEVYERVRQKEVYSLPCTGWSKFYRVDVIHLKYISGNHYSMIRDADNSRELGECISSALNGIPDKEGLSYGVLNNG